MPEDDRRGACSLLREARPGFPHHHRQEPFDVRGMCILSQLGPLSGTGPSWFGAASRQHRGGLCTIPSHGSESASWPRCDSSSLHALKADGQGSLRRHGPGLQQRGIFSSVAVRGGCLQHTRSLQDRSGLIGAGSCVPGCASTLSLDLQCRRLRLDPGWQRRPLARAFKASTLLSNLKAPPSACTVTRASLRRDIVVGAALSDALMRG